MSIAKPTGSPPRIDFEDFVASSGISFNDKSAFIESDMSSYPDGTLAVSGGEYHVKVAGAVVGTAGSIKNDWEPLVFDSLEDLIASRQPERDGGPYWIADGRRYKQADAAVLDNSFSNASGVKFYDEQLVPLPSPPVLSISTGLVRTLEDGDVFDLDGSKLGITSGYDSGALISLKNTGYGYTSVTSVENDVTADYSNGDGSLSRVSRILAPGHTFNVGDTLKLGSDDLIPHQHNSDEREGEFIVVALVDGDYIYTTHRVFGNYTTGIFVVRPSNARVSINDLKIGYSGSSGNASGVSLRGFVNPVINVKEIYDFLGPAINLVGCVNPRVMGGWFHYLRNNGQYLGYGVNDVSCQSGLYSDLHGSFLRHLYTSNVNSTDVGDGNWYQRGRSMHSIVTGSSTFGCAGGFDTHPDMLGLSISNCLVEGSPRLQDSSGSAFQMRGPRFTISNCKSVGSKVGLLIDYDTEETIPSRGIINGFESIDDETSIRIRGDAGDRALVIASSISVQKETGNNVIDAQNSDVKISGLSVSIGSGVPDNSQILDALSSNVTLKNLSVDYSGNAFTDHRLFRVRDENCVLKIDAEIEEGGSSKLGAVGECNHSGVDHVVDANVVYEKETTDIAGFLNAPAGSDLLLKAIDGIAHRSLIFNNYTSGTGYSVLMSNASWEHVIVRITCTASGASIDNIDDGKFRGQLLTIQNRGTSTEGFSLSSSAISDNGIPNIEPQSAVTLFWDGSSWQLATGSRSQFVADATTGSASEINAIKNAMISSGIMSSS